MWKEVASMVLQVNVALSKIQPSRQVIFSIKNLMIRGQHWFHNQMARIEELEPGTHKT